MKSTALLLIIACYYALATKDSYSFYKFNGPVSGKIEEVYIDAGTPQDPQKQQIDFTAKPHYAYSYGVDDPNSGTSQAHKESRDGDKVLGEYRIVQPDGLVRIVRYIADPVHGFQVDVQYVPINQPPPPPPPAKKVVEEDEEEDE